MVNFNPNDYGNNCQFDLVNTKESVLPVWNKPYHTIKRKAQKGEEIDVLRNCSLLWQLIVRHVSPYCRCTHLGGHEVLVPVILVGHLARGLELHLVCQHRVACHTLHNTLQSSQGTLRVSNQTMFICSLPTDPCHIQNQMVKWWKP